jgi:hypothetical protein
VCASLDQVVRRDAHRVGLACAVRELRDPVRACPPALADVALALVTLAHEAEHVSGVTDEAETECDARQNVRQLALRLSVKPGQAAILGRYAGRRARMPAEYQSAECRDGGRYDLRPSSHVFP